MNGWASAGEYAFGHFIVNPATRQLLKEGAPARLGAKAFDLLVALIERRDRVVTKDELLELVWPNLVVEENTLQVHISSLRKLIGTQAIATIPGRGYRFTAPPATFERALVPGTQKPGAATVQIGADTLAPSAPAAPMAMNIGRDAGGRANPRRRRSDRLRLPMLLLGLVAVLALAVTLGPPLTAARRGAPGAAAVEPDQEVASAPDFAPPAHSLAVLPFVNLSGDPRQDYFSDGLAEELLNCLASVSDLRVAARTSSFLFRGGTTKIAEIGRQLNVGAVLEGSVRKDGGRVRISAQLIDTVTGYHLWSQSYDRDLTDILGLQSELAAAVTRALRATLLAGADATIELGGTRNPLALEAYLRGIRWRGNAHTQEETEAAIAEFAEAIRLDPKYARAYASKASFLLNASNFAADAKTARAIVERARATAQAAVALAPQLGHAHAVLASVLWAGLLDFRAAADEFDRALVLSPGHAVSMASAASFFADMGRADEAVTLARRMLVLDPLSANAHFYAAQTLYAARRYREAISEYTRALSLNPQQDEAAASRGLAYLAVGELEAASRSCSTPPIDWVSHTCLAIVYDKQHQRAQSDQQLAGLLAESGENAAYQVAEIYAQWGDASQAISWIEKAYRLGDGGLIDLKVDPLLDGLRTMPQFQELERKLRFPA